jgi:GGDEF domain-containing protein
MYDALTDPPNRVLFRDRLDNALERTRREPLATNFRRERQSKQLLKQIGVETSVRRVLREETGR